MSYGPDRTVKLWRHYYVEVAAVMGADVDAGQVAASLTGSQLVAQALATRSASPAPADDDRIGDDIARLAGHLGHHPAALRGYSQRPHLTAARHAVIAAIRLHHKLSLTATAEHFSGRDHSTIRNSCTKADPDLVAELIDVLRTP